MNDSPRLAVFATHPIQYHAPWFRSLVAEGVELRVFFSVIPDAAQQAVGFGGEFRWDVPLLEGYPWVVLPSAHPSPTLGSFRGLRNTGVGRALLEFAPDVVIVTGWNAFPLLQATRAAIQLGIPRVVRGESNAMHARPLWKGAGHRALLSLYDAFVGIGVENRSFYEANGVPPDRIFDGGYFVDNEFFEHLALRDLPLRAGLREAWGIPCSATCFLFSGKLVPKKHPLDFLEAVGIAAARLGPDAVHALVVGSGEQEPEMREMAAAARLPVTFTGFLNQTEMGRAYSAADALVLPSGFGETWGLVVNEAMLFGLPALVSDRVGCGPDLVTDDVTGFTYSCGDVEALACRLASLAAEPELRARLGAGARLRIRSYTPGRGARATIRAARAAAGG